MDLVVDGSLDDTNQHLKSIHDEFKNMKKHTDEDKDIWGQHDLKKAMDAFEHNWYVHRDKIDKRLEDLSKKVDEAVTAWSDADKQLSDNLEASTDA
jgi:hypothetical protein